ncbi:MAG: energy transducer TonB, partial [Rickettsiales bacterium]|nr:energy transducer TonB [Rickettsiales bacterium]
GNSNMMENAISQAVTPEEATAAKSAISSMEKALAAESSAVDKAIDKALANSGNDALAQESRRLASAAKQFVRTSNAQAKGSSRANSTAKEAELMSRYEQLISLWIEKFKQYPMEARMQGLQGETVVRIRIDRKGNIRYYILENSTGHQELDRAAIEMVRRANPVPAVPNDYPRGDLIEFLIPVNFHLQ